MKNKTLNLKQGSQNALLFDMDGTLTPARKSISKEMHYVLHDLCRDNHLVCIVSGSPMHYIEEQLKLSQYDYPSSLVIMPCNGTQVYTQNESSKKYEMIYSLTMKDHLEQTSQLSDPYRELVTNILELQSYATRKYKFPLTGNFISDRGSMANWCMIGRDASHEDRATFTFEDKNNNLRKHLRECLRVRLDASDLHMIDLTLGGSTSIDIFPKGWDKTYALRHIDPALKVWFWGDKCMPGGNDHALYQELQKHNRSFSVESPEETIASIEALQKSEQI